MTATLITRIDSGVSVNEADLAAAGRDDLEEVARRDDYPESIREAALLALARHHESELLKAVYEDLKLRDRVSPGRTPWQTLRARAEAQVVTGLRETVRALFNIEDGDMNLLARVPARSSVDALSVYADRQGFPRYDELAAAHPEEWGDAVYTLPNGRPGAVFTNFEIQAYPYNKAAREADEVVRLETLPNGTLVRCVYVDATAPDPVTVEEVGPEARFVVETIHEGSDWCLRRATDAEVADEDEETLPYDEALEHVREVAAEHGTRWFDFSGDPAPVTTDETTAADPLGSPEGVTSAGTKVEDDPKQELLDLIEDEWYKRTKGELYLTAEDDGEQDAALAGFVLKMAEEVDEYVTTTACAQTDGHGHDIFLSDGEPLPRREVARRIAAALDLLHFGGQA